MVSHAREAIVTELIQAFLAHPFERRDNVAKAVLLATEQRGLDESDLDLDKVQRRAALTHWQLANWVDAVPLVSGSFFFFFFFAHQLSLVFASP